MGVEGEELVQDLPRQLAAALQPLGAGGVHRPGLGQVRREPPGRGEEVHPHAHNGILQTPGLQIQGGLGEDAAHLLSPAEHIVDPFDLGLHPGAGLNGQGHRRRGAGGQQQGVLGGEFGPQQQAQIQPRVRWGEEAVALPPLAGGLLHRRQHQPFRRPFLRPLAQEGVGGGYRLRHLHLQPRHGEVPGDALGGEEGTVHIQTVPPVGDRLDGIPALPQLGDGLPHGVAAHLELLGQGLAGEIGAPAGLQGSQDAVFHLGIPAFTIVRTNTSMVAMLPANEE